MGGRGRSPEQQQTQPKPIRFVNSEGRPAPKRRRVDSACKTCRKRKIRCDGKRPICSTSAENGHTCLGYADEVVGYSSADPKRESKQKHLASEGQDGDFERYSDIASERQSPHSRRSAPERPHSRTSLEIRSRSTAQHDQGNPTRKTTESTEDQYPLPPGDRRVPYFRYFGPTAIVPGFKAMVVSLRRHRGSVGGFIATPSRLGGDRPRADHHRTSSNCSDSQAIAEIPVYDLDSGLPLSPLIKHLVEVFFTHIGCSYPFLKKEKVMRMLDDKLLDPLLVDAICSLSARFTNHPLIVSHEPGQAKSDYGNVFAHRAKAAIIETFPCPTVSAVQACLLLAYEGFGAGQDSALWMFLGCAIRMATDLGLQKLEGVRYQGLSESHSPQTQTRVLTGDKTRSFTNETEQQAAEEERSDTLWAVFMLDRFISSGTGRPVAMHVEDFELSFPGITNDRKTGWPKPFPALLQIINLYGRMSDLLNNIKTIKDLNEDKKRGLASMEKDLTTLYQRLDQRLTFNAINFQYYVKAGEGTNFILLHFWFHTLIMLLHEPMLLVEGKIRQLLPHSRELSMSSAKTIADILAFAELIDGKSFIGNPFTSQPIYIAACAFLIESASQTSSQSRSEEQPPEAKPGRDERNSKAWSKSSSLAATANQNYQRCYKALQQLRTYWAGTQYILTALDQKAEGIWDPETYTMEEMESTKLAQVPIPTDWHQKLPQSATGAVTTTSSSTDSPSPSMIDPSQAIGWSLTGTTNSPNSNLTFLYQSQMDPQPQGVSSMAGHMGHHPTRQNWPESAHASRSTSGQDFLLPHRHSFLHDHLSVSAQPYTEIHNSIGSSAVADAEMLLGLQQTPNLYSSTQSYSASDMDSHVTHNFASHNRSAMHSVSQTVPAKNIDYRQSDDLISTKHPSFSVHPSTDYTGIGPDDMMIQSQDINMSALSGEMMPWLEYLPQDIMSYFDAGGPSLQNNTVGGPGSSGANSELFKDETPNSVRM